MATWQVEHRKNRSSLLPSVRGRADVLIGAAWAAGIPLYISAARRTVSEQQRLVAAGASKTLNSYHLLGRAFDVDVVGWGRDDVPRDIWNSLGTFATRQLGLRWGGNFKGFFDAGHFEL